MAGSDTWSPTTDALALCVLYPSVDFFLPAGGDAQAARDVCAECPIQLGCREWATFHEPQAYGIWGGTTPLERRKLRKASGGPLDAFRSGLARVRARR
jgi:hypothetical protein